ncbi:uncharacterized protein EKO05_0001796 [Ascochyta rabiei]|uniref:uncharacterized protein n=1 Tax=Didymella rabiei TaxID=5454 RepID=UPI001901DC06|nr:uncharacterized protein EKO05_0001796 [Ascochyta rabiei]UPX11174.1 hypothetical protein EKO05_0001796 [Ascochyta rabiei]
MANKNPPIPPEGNEQSVKRHHGSTLMATYPAHKTIDQASKMLTTLPSISSVMGLQLKRSPASNDIAKNTSPQAALENATEGSSNASSRSNHVHDKAPRPAAYMSSASVVPQVLATAKPIKTKGEAGDKNFAAIRDDQNGNGGPGPKPCDQGLEAKKQDLEERAEEARELYVQKMVAAGHWHVQDRPSGG